MRKHILFLSSVFPFIGYNGPPLCPQNVKTSVQKYKSYHYNANDRFGFNDIFIKFAKATKRLFEENLVQPVVIDLFSNEHRHGI